ncbi:TonB-dependent receptor domain-containing protein [Paracidobacterium acidisoli]|uniref:TonB-dependent receptor n=1 Tax=Paracidobacterium acidisoli TaxID=2303751 RepID=A0A372IN42_9BACT|nr:TonB-dependent receptor [Paracidobacterium acidisoli]MBT9331958.1 TonB-dependent receptor [Paracidobacterium acidisoli]
MIRRLRGILAWSMAAALFVLIPLASHAQAIYGSLYGTVTDNTGAVIPGATITVTDESKGTSVTATSNESGEYTVQHLIPDTYDVKVELTGFQQFETKGIQVLADTSPKVDVQLSVGGTSQTVTVSANAIPQIKTDRADVATEFTSKDLSDLPIPDRNFTNLQLLLPGAQQLSWAHASDEDPQGSKQIQVDGQAFGGVAFVLDGTDNQDPILGIIVINPPLDALSETKITTQNFDAELGKAVSSVITAQTKSGTNNFHGSAFDYRESNKNLARDPYAQFPGSGPFPPGLKNQFGGSLGGPIFKDRLFFFGDYQGVRSKTGIVDTQTVPSSYLTSTCLGLTTPPGGTPGCDFTEYVNNVPNTKIVDQSTGKTYPNNVIPAADLSPQALALLKLLQPYAPNTSGLFAGLKNNYSASGTGLFNNDQWDVRVDDQVIPDKAHAFARFSRFTSTLSGSTIFGPAGGAGFGVNGYGGTSTGADDSLAAGMDIAVSPKWLTDFRIGYYRYNVIARKYDQGTDLATQLGIPGLNMGDFYTSGAPYFNIADVDVKGGNGPNNPTDGGSQYGSGLNLNRCNCPLTEREDQFQVVNNWTRILGNHAIKFGADLRYARNLRVPSDTDRAGILGFAPGPTSDGSSGGLGFATFVLGRATSLGRYVSTSTNAKEFQKRFFFYAQDTWHTTPKLTVSYGLRYEFYGPESVNGKGNGALLNLSTGYLQVAGYGNIGSNMNWDPAKWSFNPRLGIAYQFDERTVIRAGYGRSFDIGVFGSIFGHTATQNLPVLANQSINQTGGPTSTAFCLGASSPGCTQPNGQPVAGGPASYPFPAIPSNGLLPDPGYSVNSKARPNPLRLPTLDAWNLSLQHAITPTLSFTLAYVGNKGTHTLSSGDGNSTNPNEPAIFLPASFSTIQKTLHYTTKFAEGSAVPDTNGIYPDGGVTNSTFLRRYYGGTLPACQDSNYMTPDAANNAINPNIPNEAGITPGMCGWSQDIQYNGSDQDTHYNALQATLAKQLSHGISFNLAYAWQRGFAWNSGFSTWDRSAVKVRDPEIREQQIVIFGTYDLPFGKNRMFASNAPRFVDEIIGGWNFSPVLTWSGGLPFTLGFQECSSFVPSDAPCYVNGSGSHLKHSLGGFDPIAHTRRYFTGTSTPLYNTTTGQYSPFQGFSATQLDQIGSGGGNNVYGPHFFNGDLSLQKNFPIYESLLAQFRIDAYNGFNYMNANNPSNTNIDGGSTAGVITNGPGINGYTDPRQLQFSLRVQF